MDHDPIYKEFLQFIKAFFSYVTSRVHGFGLSFEKVKNFIVDILMVRRGANTSVFVHLSIIGIALTVLIAGGVISPTSVVSGSYPGVPVNPLVAGASVDNSEAIISSSITPVTIVSDKPRDKIVEYEVKSGDTVTSVAQNFQVSVETVIWENNLSKESLLKEGQKLRILPVSGVAHKVEAGDSIYSVAKTYQANAQAIIDFPFNDIGDNFALTTDSTLIVPDGAPPTKAKPAPTQYLASEMLKTPVSNLGSAQFIWPAVGQIAQYFSWYHPGLDISNLGGGPIHASDSGTVVYSGWDGTGYGNTILLDHGNGYKTRYGHMSVLYAANGQSVAKGEVIGMMGSTGRSTGVHLHFEIVTPTGRVNPYSVLGK